MAPLGQRGIVKTVFNFPVDEMTLTNETLQKQLLEIYKQSERAFKANASMGLILVDENAGTSSAMHYYYPSRNNEK